LWRKQVSLLKVSLEVLLNWFNDALESINK
jgi:hypothetical protein